MITDEQVSKLINAAEEGVKNAFSSKRSPDDYRVGAAVLTKQGNIYSSGQYASRTATLTIHAEPAVLIHAAAHGEYDIVAIAITGNEKTYEYDDIVYPCHLCKQLLWENSLASGLDIEIIIAKNGKVQEKLQLKSIINYPWPTK